MENSTFENQLYVKEIYVSDDIPKDNYISGLPVVKHLMQSSITFTKPVTFFVGENGIGKSTLIEALAVSLGFNAEGGSKNFNFATRNSHSNLFEYLTVVKNYRRARDGYFLRAESFYNVATNIDDMDGSPSFDAPIISNYGGISLHEQSHGESFMALVENRFGGNGIYILDEPEAALSPMRLMSLICRINDLVKKNSQFIISTHSPILMTMPNSEVFEITKNGVESVPYTETEHYRITMSMLKHPDKMLGYLLD